MASLILVCTLWFQQVICISLLAHRYSKIDIFFDLASDRLSVTLGIRWLKYIIVEVSTFLSVVSCIEAVYWFRAAMQLDLHETLPLMLKEILGEIWNCGYSIVTRADTWYGAEVRVY